MGTMAWILVTALVVGIVGGEPLVKSSLGTIAGKSDSFEGVEVESFLGIPYAKPPVGDLRFAPPQAFGPVGELNATQFSAACNQPSILFTVGLNLSEDCLYLNVFRKAGTQQDAKKAVLFVIHAGSFARGSGSEEVYNALPITALGDVIVVTINYRLAIFGFADMKDLAPGNLGLHDQLSALEWVRDNIAAFGGDPDRVTLIGVSAGSMSVSSLVMTPLVRGKNLFKQVVMDGGVMSTSTVSSQDVSLDRVKKIAAKVGCETEGEKMLSCLRSANATQLADLSYDPDMSSAFTFLPTVDGKFFTVDPSKDILENADKFVDVRMMIGIAKDDGSMFAELNPSVKTLKTEAEFLALCQELSKGYSYKFALDQKDVKDALVQTYFGKSADHFNDVSDLISDGSFRCPMSAFVKNYAKTHKSVFVFEFDRIMKSQFLRYGKFDPKLGGAFHGSPFLHLFGSHLAISDESRKGSLDPEDAQFMRESIKMLSDFVKSDDAPQLRNVTWPNYSSGEGILLIDNNTTVATSLPNQDRCQKVFSYLETA